MIKLFFKLLKYSLIIYLMICVKNLYSETFNNSSMITVEMPNIIDLDAMNEQSDNEEPSIFAEKMEYFSTQSEKKREEEEKLLEEARKRMMSAESYRQALEEAAKIKIGSQS